MTASSSTLSRALLFLLGLTLIVRADDAKTPASAPPLSLVVHNTESDNVFLPSEEKKVVVTVQNLTANPQTAVLTMQGTTDDGTPLNFKQSIDLAASASVDVPVTLDLKGPSFADCTFSLGDGGPTERTTFAVVRPQDVATIPFDKSCFGTCNMGRPLAAQKMGVRFNRTFLFWRWSEPKEGQYNFARYYDGGKPFEDLGIHMIYTFEPNYPDWVGNKTSGIKNMMELSQPDPLQKYSTWVAEGIKEAPPGPKAYEFANEPDISLGRLGDVNAGIATTAALIKTGYDLVKAADPTVPVLGVDVSSGGPRDHEFATKALEQIGGKIDEYSVHAYGEQHYVKTDGSVIWPDEYLAGMMEPNVKLADQYTNAKGIWSTEVGWAYPWQETFLSDSTRTFGQIVGQLLVLVKTIPHFEKMAWFRGSAGWGTNERGYDYSLIAQSKEEQEVKGFHPTTGVSAFATASSLLEGCDIGQKIDLGPALHAYIFENQMSHKVVVAAWAIKYDVSLATPLPAGFSIVDLDGREHSVAAGGKYTLNRGPSFLVADLAKEQDFKTFLTSAKWQPDQSFVVASLGATTTKALDLTVTNFTTTDANVDLTLPTGSIKATLHSGDNAVSVPLAADAFAGPHLDLPLKISSDSATSNFHVDKQLVGASYAPAGTFAPDGVMTPQKTALAANVLQDRNNVYPTDPSVPWKGADDLGVKFGYSWSEKGLYALIIARDDIHIAIPDTGNGFWNFDCLQMGFGPAGQRTKPGYQPGDHEIGLALSTSGQSRFFQPFPAGDVPAEVLSKVTRTGQDTIYEFLLPWSYVLGTDQPAASAVINMNFIVSDNDGSGRKCWMGLYDGIADGKRPGFFPWVHLLPKTP